MIPSTHTATAERVGRREWAWVLVWVLFVMALTCVPYGYALRIADGRTFGGFLWGVDEGNVYLAWLRQAGAGEAFLRNQYCLAPENPRFFNLFMQVGGRLGALCHWSPLVTFHGLRLLGGLFLLLCFYRLAAELTSDRVARWAALTLASLGSGLGWLVVLKDGWLGLHPVDVGTKWQVQPEAVTFPALLLNGLFTVAMGLMCLVFRYALRAVRDDDRGAVWRGGLCLLLLGNIHTYDVFPVWLALALWAVVGLRRLPGKLVTLMAMGLPAVIWAFYAAQADPAFLAKGLTPTPAFRFVDYAVGYGLVGALAVVGAALVAWRCRRPEGPASAGPAVPAPGEYERKMADGDLAPRPLSTEYRGENGPTAPDNGGPAQARPLLTATATATVTAPSLLLLPVAWALANSLVLLIPVSFQRKMIEGLHLPLCVLAGLAVAWLGERMTRGLRARGKLQQARERVVLTLIGVVVFTLPSNAMFLANCLVAAKSNNRELLGVMQPPIYLHRGDAAALQWLRSHATRDDIVLSSSFIGSYVPTYCEARPWVGHWAETLALESTSEYFGPDDPLQAWDWVWSPGNTDGELAVRRFGDQLQVAHRLYAGQSAHEWYKGSNGLNTPRLLRDELCRLPLTLVYYGPYERALTGAEKDESGATAAVARWRGLADRALTKVYDRGGVTIYRVPPAGPATEAMGDEAHAVGGFSRSRPERQSGSGEPSHGAEAAGTGR